MSPKFSSWGVMPRYGGIIGGINKGCYIGEHNPSISETIVLETII